VKTSSHTSSPLLLKSIQRAALDLEILLSADNKLCCSFYSPQSTGLNKESLIGGTCLLSKLIHPFPWAFHAISFSLLQPAFKKNLLFMCYSWPIILFTSPVPPLSKIKVFLHRRQKARKKLRHNYNISTSQEHVKIR